MINWKFPEGAAASAMPEPRLGFFKAWMSLGDPKF
jgi:hypothetical protein